MADNDDERASKRIKIEEEGAQNLPVPAVGAQPAPEQPDMTLSVDVKSDKASEDPTQAPAEASEVIIDPRGDVKLVCTGLDESVTIYIVCSKTLARHSSYFEARLFPSGPGTQGVQVTTITLALRCPSQKSLETVLNVLHCNTIKTTPSFSHTTGVLFYGREFNIMPVLLMYGMKWYKYQLEATTSQSYKMWGTCASMWITNDLGLDDDCHSAIEIVLPSIHIKDYGSAAIWSPFRSGLERLTAFFLADSSLIRLLFNLRSSFVQVQLEHLQVITNSLLHRQPIPNTSRDFVSGCQECIYKWTGCIIQNLSHPVGRTDAEVPVPALWPVPQPEAYHGSIEHLQDRLRAVQQELNGCQKCRNPENTQAANGGWYGGKSRRGGQRGRGNRGGGGAGFGNSIPAMGRPCEPPNLLIAYPSPSVLNEIKGYKTRYKRENDEP